MKESSKPFVRDLRKGLDSLGLVQVCASLTYMINDIQMIRNAKLDSFRDNTNRKK